MTVVDAGRDDQVVRVIDLVQTDRDDARLQPFRQVVERARVRCVSGNTPEHQGRRFASSAHLDVSCTVFPSARNFRNLPAGRVDVSGESLDGVDIVDAVP